MKSFVNCFLNNPKFEVLPNEAFSRLLRLFLKKGLTKGQLSRNITSPPNRDRIAQVMKIMHRILITALGLILPWLMASGEVKETRQLIQEWVETERILSEEKSKWDSDRAMLLELLASLKAESKALDEQLEK